MTNYDWEEDDTVFGLTNKTHHISWLKIALIVIAALGLTFYRYL